MGFKFQISGLTLSIPSHKFFFAPRRQEHKKTSYNRRTEKTKFLNSSLLSPLPPVKPFLFPLRPWRPLRVRESHVFSHFPNPIQPEFSVTPLLPMTNRTARETFDFVLLHKLLPERDLIRRGLPIHAEDLLARPYKTLGVEMAF